MQPPVVPAAQRQEVVDVVVGRGLVEMVDVAVGERCAAAGPSAAQVAPEDLAAAANSYLEVILTATDSNNGVTAVTRDFLPNTINITLRVRMSLSTTRLWANLGRKSRARSIGPASSLGK